MSTDETDTEETRISITADTLGVSESLSKAADTTQLADRNASITIGDALSPPYPPENLAALQELNGTHAIAIAKKSTREVGFGFELTPHPRVDDPSDDQRETVDAFWHGRESVWKIGPQGTPTATPTEVFENARQDYHGIGWLAIELLYGSDDELAGLAHLPAKSVRVRAAEDSDDEDVQTAGYGYVQQRNNEVVYFAEAGDRHPGEGETPTYVDRETGEIHEGDRPESPANELLFIPNPHPNALYYGIPAWVSEVQTMIGDREAKRFNRDFFEWDALGQYAVVVEGGTLTQESRDSITAMIQNLRDQQGRRVAVLEAEELAEKALGDDAGEVNIRIEPLTQQGEEDMSFSEYRRANEHDIAKVHEVPPIVIGVTDSANRSNSQEQIRDFTKEVIEPAQERFAGRLYRIIHQQVLDVDDWTIDFETRGAENERETAEVTDIKLRSGRLTGTMTVNEAREEQGLEPLEGPMGEMTIQEFQAAAGGGGGPGAALDRALEENREQAEQAARTEARIQRGATADDD